MEGKVGKAKMAKSKSYNWGIIATGAIARQFSIGLNFAPGAVKYAVASRELQKAESFADEYGFRKAYGSYEELLADPKVDIVYIATPHQFHTENTIAALKAKKAVLCEKPFAVNAAAAKEMVKTARENNCLLMEAMWTRFIPAVQKAKEMVEQGEIGDIRMITGDFGYRTEVGVPDRIYDPAACGGGLMDVGIYPVSLASMFFKEQPEEIQALAEIGSTSVDEQSAYLFRYKGGEMAVLYSAIRTETPVEAVIMGTRGRIKLHAPFYKADKISVVKENEERIISIPYEGNGYEFEAIEMMRCMSEGLLESPVMPLDESVAVMETMDRIRSCINLCFPYD
ncbi:MAG: Gfo/Idh/MocA family protein [Caldicoprobacterales bacterium]|jgi:predicted dehydrogenase